MKPNLRATGILVSHQPSSQLGEPDFWLAKAEFMDLDAGSTATLGVIQTTPHVDLGAALREVLAEARTQSLGFRGPAEAEQPWLYAAGDGEDPRLPLPQGWRQQLADAAREIGFLPGFTVTPAVETSVQKFLREHFPTVGNEAADIMARMLEGAEPSVAVEWSQGRTTEDKRAACLMALNTFTDRPVFARAVFRDPPPRGQTMFAVTLESRGNPDYGQDPARPVSPRLTGYVNTLGEASKLCRQYIGQYDLGGGQWTGGKVEFTDPTKMSGQLEHARISYNGRVWPAGTWTPQMAPLPEPDLGVPAGTLQDRELAADLYIHTGLSSTPVSVNADGLANFLDAAYFVHGRYGDEGLEALEASVHGTDLRDVRSGAATMPDGTKLGWELLNGLEIEHRIAAGTAWPQADQDALAPVEIEEEETATTASM